MELLLYLQQQQQTLKGLSIMVVVGVLKTQMLDHLQEIVVLKLVLE
jgi:hypothetical protein